MPLLVQKYGGSSVADLDRLRAVARKIVDTRRQGHDLVVVVSAMGDTTDELLEMARQLAPTPSRRELDMLLSVGERISMALLSMAIHTEGLEAVSLTGSQCGIITTASHANARIIDVRPFRVQDALAEGKIVIVAGYQGTSYRREVTTLGRGGSDTTAVALAAALGAEACEIYSDVDGVYSADPRVVLDAVQLTSLSYEEMLEMARAGAKVLNEEAVAFARRAQIALYARSTHQPDSRGTVIRADGFDERAEAAEAGRPSSVAVAHVTRLLMVRADGASADGLARELDAQDCLAWSWQPGRACVAAIKLDDLHDRQARERAWRELGDEVVCREAGAVSVVGTGVGSKPMWARQGQRVLRERGISTEALLTSALRLTWLLREPDQVEQAAQALHAHFVTAP